MLTKARFLLPFTVLFILLLYYSCSKDEIITGYKTKNVIVVVVDGARYLETWADSGRRFIPHRAAMLKEGVLCDHMYNNGVTFTNPGHTAICTGVYQNINNGGMEYPQNPSIFQCWLKKYQRPSSEAWVIATKDKLEVLSDCVNEEWHGKYRPMTDCGNNGLGTGYRQDSVTFHNASSIFSSYHPRLTLINFKQPDAAGHANDTLGYLQGIADTDNYIRLLWEQLQNDPFYAGCTTLIVTNDHGRHSPGHLDGFISHSDNCEGCRHIEFFGMGPDFKKNYTCSTTYDQTDIASTIAQLMNFRLPLGQGKVMTDVLK